MSEESSLSFSGLVIGAAVIAGALFQTYFLKIVVVVVVFFFGRRVGAPENVGAVGRALVVLARLWRVHDLLGAAMVL